MRSETLTRDGINIDFSVIVPTRNRPSLLRSALRSILDQSYESVEIIVVNDGSDDRFEEEYLSLLSSRVTFIALEKTRIGHGQSYAMNFGVARANGEYICFLDDDDCWIDRGHLARASQVMGNSRGTVDILFSNQVAYFQGKARSNPVWLDNLLNQVKRPLSPTPTGAYEVTVQDLLECSGFCHLNTTIVRKNLFEKIGGLDEDIRYASDRDFYFRIIDTAQTIMYLPNVTARHNIPDPEARANMSTVLSELEKLLYEMRVVDKAILFGQSDAIRDYGKRHKAYALKKIATLLSNERQYGRASYYAKEALLTSFNLKWLAYTIFVMLNEISSKISSKFS